MWTFPRTWVTSEIVTASIMNTHVRDNLKYIHGDSGPVTIINTLTLPASDPTTDNMASRRLYIANKLAAKTCYTNSGTQLYYGTAPTTWTALATGVNSVLCIFQVGPSSTAPNNVIFRTQPGLDNWDGCTYGWSDVAADIIYIICQSDSTGNVYWECVVAATNLYVYLVGYIK